MFEYGLKFHWNLFLRVKLTIFRLGQIMAWRRPGDKPLSEPMMVSLLTHICVTWPQWVNNNLLNPSSNLPHSNQCLSMGCASTDAKCNIRYVFYDIPKTKFLTGLSDYILYLHITHHYLDLKNLGPFSISYLEAQVTWNLDTLCCKALWHTLQFRLPFYNNQGYRAWTWTPIHMWILGVITHPCPILKGLEVKPWMSHYMSQKTMYVITLIARFMGPTWGPSGTDKSQVGPMLAPWTLPSG